MGLFSSKSTTKKKKSSKSSKSSKDRARSGHPQNHLRSGARSRQSLGQSRHQRQDIAGAFGPNYYPFYNYYNDRGVPGHSSRLLRSPRSATPASLATGVHHLPQHCLEDFFVVSRTPQSTSDDLYERDRKSRTNLVSDKDSRIKKKKIPDSPLKVRVRRLAQSGDRIGCEYHSVVLNRVPGFGFGIAVSGGRDNPHFMHGDPSIAISDVLKAGPAEGKLQVNDRVVSANGISLENVDYTAAVQVLHSCGNSVNLLVKRRVLLPTSSDLLKVTLTKNKKKDDFGIVLGCRLYIKEIANRSIIEKDSSLQEGDVILKINNAAAEGLSLKEAKKLIDGNKEGKLHLVVRREQNSQSNNRTSEINQRNNYNGGGNLYENGLSSNGGLGPVPIKGLGAGHLQSLENGTSNNNQVSGTRPNWSNQNVYVQPPTRGGGQHQLGQLPSPPRNRGPLNNISLTQLDQPATPTLMGSGDHEPPPRPPPPRSSAYDGLHTSASFAERGDDDELTNSHQTRRKHASGAMPISTEPRRISFKKDGQVGIRLTGGNEVGIFVTAVQQGCPAYSQGLVAGDKILKVNNMDLRDVTREEAVLFLLSVQEQVDLVVQHRLDEYEDVVSNQRGDNFYIRAHFAYSSSNKGELSFQSGEVLRVVDTLYNGVVGSWQVYRLGRNNQEIQKGLIPNRSRAEELAAEEAAEKAKKAESGEGSSSRSSFFRRRSARRSKSLTRDHWEEVSFAEGGSSKFPAYERVALKHPGFIRPVVIFGPLADIARDKLLKDYPDKYGSPQTERPMDEAPKSSSSKISGGGIVRLSSIKEIVEKGKHALLDITPSAVNRLNYAQFYPIVIFMRAETKTTVKELRSRYTKSVHKSSRKLFEQSVKLEKLWSHVFTSTIALTSADMWYKKLRETIERQQGQNIWAAESKPEESITDDFLFPMNSSRLSYASSPESDLDLTLDSKGNECDDSPRALKKASSDPSIATNDDIPGATAFNMSSSSAPGNHRSRQELSKALKRDSKAEPKTHMSPEMGGMGGMGVAVDDDVDREEYFGTSSKEHSNYNTLYPSDRYPPGQGPPNDNTDIYGVGSVRAAALNGHPLAAAAHTATTTAGVHNGPEPPPRIDRAKKPPRFRSAHERLFGRPDPRDRDNDDYINTAAPEPPRSASKSNSLERGVLGGPGGHENGSFSSDSYNKYGSPSATLDNSARYGTIGSKMNGSPSQTLLNGQHRLHDPYRFTRSTGLPTPSMAGAQDRNSKALPPPKSIYDRVSANVRPVAPPSPPPKPVYQSQLGDGRPVPPPKPVHYQSRISSGWRGGAPDGAPTESTYGQTNGSNLPSFGSYGMPSSQPSTPKRASSAAMDMGNGPPGYFHSPSKDQPPLSRAPPPPSVQDLAYSTQSTFASPARRLLYSDTESGYLTGKSSNYSDLRSQYSSKTSSSRTSSNLTSSGLPALPSSSGNNHSQGAYLNLPYQSMSGQRDSTAGGPGNNSIYNQPPPPPPPMPSSNGIVDLSANARESRGSAFELYRKPGESSLMASSSPLRSNGHYMGSLGLPPPPPPLATEVETNDNRRDSTASSDSNQNVVAVAKGHFSSKGGTLTSYETGVQLVIPPGALASDQDQEIYFKVCQDTSMLPPLDSDKGETLLSPIVMCGPRGLTFSQPVELRLPHSASSNPDTWSFALKSSDTSEGKANEWQNVAPGGGDGIAASKIDPNFVSVLVDHF